MVDPQLTILRSNDELETMRSAWAQLWQRDPQATPFQRPEWLLPWWHQFGTQSPRVLIIRHGDVLAGFLPFYVYMDAATKERQLHLMGAGTSDYLDGLFAPECTVAEVCAALRQLDADAEWDMLYASQLRPESKLALALAAGVAERGYTFTAESTSRMPAVPMADLPQKIRRNAMYYRNRALRLGTLTLTTADAANCMDAFADLERLHTARWQGRGEAGVLADPAVLAWHREALPELARSGCLRLYTLRLDDGVLGVLYSLIDPPSSAARTQYFYLTAYAQAHADLRPGTLLLAFAIQAASEQGVTTIDMLRGEEAYKEMWHLERMPVLGFALRAQPSSAVQP